jgi:hypothetical protein
VYQNINNGTAALTLAYSKCEPNRREIEEEIKLLKSLRGVNNIVQLEALFDDPPHWNSSG